MRVGGPTCNKRKINSNGIRPSWSPILGEQNVKGEKRKERRGRRRRRKPKKCMEFVKFCMNLYGNYDFGMNYWTFGLLYEIV